MANWRAPGPGLHTERWVDAEDGDMVMVGCSTKGQEDIGLNFSVAEWRAIVEATRSVWGVQHYDNLDALIEETKRKAKE